MASWVWELKPGDQPNSIKPVHIPNGPTSLDWISENLPSGVYTTLRTYHHNQTLAFESHVQRLEQSAALAGSPCKLEGERLRTALRLVLSHISDEQEARLRLTLDLEQEPGAIYIAAESLQGPTPDDYSTGVKAITMKLERRIPSAKLTGFISQAREAREKLAADVNEAILVDAQGRMLEGLSSNFFAILEGELYTSGEDVLPGITRSMVLEVIDKLKIPIHLQAVWVDQMPLMQEAFITSSSRGVLPVVEIDDAKIGPGRPRQFTGAIMTGYRAWIDERIEAI
jgi:branched-chain amino acid aminotransferase